MEEKWENVMEKADSLAKLRKYLNQNPEFNKQYQESVYPVTCAFNDLVSQLELKGKPFIATPNPSDDVYKLIEKQLEKIDKNLVVKNRKFTKVYIQEKCPGVQQYLDQTLILKSKYLVIWVNPENKIENTNIFTQIAEKKIPIPQKLTNGHYPPFSAVYGQPGSTIEPTLPITDKQTKRKILQELKIKTFSPHKNRVRGFIQCTQCSKKTMYFL